MLYDLHQSLRRLLREQGGLPPGEVAIEFEQPTRQWVDSLTRPTLNFFLYEIEENTDLRQTGMETLRYDESRAIQRMPPRRFDLRYMVSVLSTVAEEEHELLWGALAVLLRFTPLPLAILPRRAARVLVEHAPRPLATLAAPFAEALADEGAGAEPLPSELLEAPLVEMLAPASARPAELQREIEAKRTFGAYLEARILPLAAAIGRAPDGPRAHDLWGSLEVPPRPALFYTLTAPVDLKIASELLTRVRRPDVSVDPGVTLAGVVRNANGMPLAGVRVLVEERGMAVTSDEQGRYTLRSLRPGSYTLRLSRPGWADRFLELTTTADPRDIVLD